MKAHTLTAERGHIEDGKRRAKDRLAGARTACAAAANASWEQQYRATQELLYARAEADEWGVLS